LSSQYVLIDGLICPYNSLVCWYALIFLIVLCIYWAGVLHMAVD